MKKLISAMVFLGLLPLTVQAKDICVYIEDRDSTYGAYYKFKIVKVPKEGSTRLSGIVVFPNLNNSTPGYAEGSVVMLANGTINYYLNPINFQGNQLANGFYVLGANKNSYMGIPFGISSAFIDCKYFPSEAMTNHQS